MADATMLTNVKQALGIEGTYQDNTLTQYVDEVMDFLTTAGVKASAITPGIVARGVSDLWNYGAGNGKFSEYFMQRATQLSYKR
ncbi:MAG: hypothetical protein J6U66_06070 [Lachnospiraceae bacterium]|nr:hypothetical protein [Lachnospiraceae bacterium]